MEPAWKAAIGASLVMITISVCRGTSDKREVRYPDRFEAVSTPSGPVMVPTQFKTRETGSFVNAVVAGVARQTTKLGKPAVQLELKDGRRMTTSQGRMIKLDGVVYRAAGWRDGAFVLVAQKSSKRLRFLLENRP